MTLPGCRDYKHLVIPTISFFGNAPPRSLYKNSPEKAGGRIHRETSTGTSDKNGNCCWGKQCAFVT